MSKDLKLLPEYYPDARYSQDVISLDFDPDLFNEIECLEKSDGVIVGGPFYNYCTSENDGSVGFKPTMESRMGDPLKSLAVSQLLSGFTSVDKLNGYKNKAAMAFLQALPPSLKVYLYWI